MTHIFKARSSKSYFDPNTGENLNYGSLMERCVTDPDNGLLFLAVEVTSESPIESKDSLQPHSNLVISTTEYTTAVVE